MGVQGLWQLLQPAARPIKIETLEGKRLAIDSSLWLYHFQMAMRDKEGRTLSNAHILGFLWRILKLLFHGIRPVFVFDGGAPVMKRKTLSGRKARRQGAKESHARTAEKLLAAQMRQAAIRHVAEGSSASNLDNQPQEDQGLGANTVYMEDLQSGRPKALGPDELRGSSSAAAIGNSSSPRASRNVSHDDTGSPSKGRKIDWHKDPYALPAMEKDLHQIAAANGKKGKRKDYRFATEDELRAVMNTIAPEDLDTTSELFRSLPAELQYELVGDLRAQSRMTSYKRLQSMLATAPTPIDFSRAQIAGLKTRNDLTQKVLTVTDEIGKANIKVPIRVAGERNKEYVLVRNPGAEGGFVLGVRDAGATQDKAIDVDYEPENIEITDDEKEKSESEAELEMDDVEIPTQTPLPETSTPADPEVEELRKEADPYKRKEKAMELLQARARYHAKQKRQEAGLDDDEENMRPRVALRKAGDRPLFIRDGRSEGERGISRGAAGTDEADDVDWIDVDADDQDLLEMAGLQDDSMDEDEAEDLARALSESQQNDNTQSQPQAKEPARLNGLKLAHRSGEPVSLHNAMQDRVRSSSRGGSSEHVMIPAATTAKGLSRQPFDDEELDEDDFEDVQPSASAPLEEVEFSAAGVEGDRNILAAPATSENRMQELAAMVGRRSTNDKGNAPKRPAPRKSLAGSLRAARRSSSQQIPQVVAKEVPSSLPAAEPAALTNEPHSTNKIEPQTPPCVRVVPDSPPPETRIRMGPPVRSASQQRIEVAGSKKDPEVSPNSVLPANSISPADQKENLERVQTPLKTAEEKQYPRLSAKNSDGNARSPVEQTPTGVATVSGFTDELREAKRPTRSALVQGQGAGPGEKRKSPSLALPEATPLAESDQRQDSPVNELPPTPEEVNRQIGHISQHSSTPEPSMNSHLSGANQGHNQTIGNVPLDNVPAVVNEAAAMDVDKEVPTTPPNGRNGKDGRNDESREASPYDWSPTPSPEPVMLGADGFPLPTAEELEAMDREDEEEIARLNADQNEFVAFLSATKGRSLLDVQREVESEVNALRAEFANSRRSEEDITKQMAQEIQMMLRLFGLPYITAPMEAEAQCAELVSRRLVDGIITDDSDVFLFGGTRIYKNMFNNNKIVECFLLSDMQRELGLDREKLVRLAYYLGSDYTEGLAGVGPVVAMELLALFPGQDGLLKFREWWLKVQTGKDTEEDTRGKTMRRIKKNLRNKVHLEPTWPEPQVLDAYYNPSVDESDEPFAWGLPDLDSLRTFLGEYLHWPITKSDQYLLPIIERQNARNRARGNQTTLDRNGFFDTSAGTGVYAGRKKVTYGSNRLQEVINGFRAANKAKGSTTAKRGNKSKTKKNGKEQRKAHMDSASSSSDDNRASTRRDEAELSSSDSEVEVVESRFNLIHIPEEQLGKEMAKKRPIVRQEDAEKGVLDGAGRRKELDAAIEALEGNAPDVDDPKRKKSATKKNGSSKARKVATAEDVNVEPAKVGDTADDALSLSSSASEEDGDDYQPAAKKRNTRTVARGRGRGGRGAGAATRGRGRGRPISGPKANLHAARNMSLDDVHRLPESRSPSVDPASLRARSRSRRSASSSSSRN